MNSLSYLSQAGLLLAVVSVLFYGLLRRETFFQANRLLLWLVVVGSLLAPVVELPNWWPQSLQPVVQHTAQAVRPLLPATPQPTPVVTVTYPNGKTYPTQLATPQAAGRIDWPLLLLVVYGVGVLFMLGRFGVQLASLYRMIRRGVAENYGDFTLVQSEQVTSPFSFFRVVALNPTRHTATELEQILRHERVHVRQWHSLDMVLAELVCIGFWFNPAAYLFRRLLHQTLEFIADRAVLTEGVDAKAYQYNLLKVSLLAHRATVVSQFGQSNLGLRVDMMNRQQTGQGRGWLHYALVVLVGLLLVTCQEHWGRVEQKYLSVRHDNLYAVLTPGMSAADLTTLKQTLANYHLDLTIGEVRRRGNGKIGQLSVTLAIPKPGHSFALTLGSPYGQAPIEPVGIFCHEAGCELGLVDERFPESLQEITQHDRAGQAVGRQVSGLVSPANQQYGLYEVYFLNDFIESNYFGVHTTALRILPDHHLSVYPEFRQAVILLDGKEITQADLQYLAVADIKKIAVFKGEVAVMRFGDQRAAKGLVLISKRRNHYIRDHYQLTDYYDMNTTIEEDGMTPTPMLNSYRQSVLKR